MKMTMAVARAVSTLKKTAKPSRTTIPSKSPIPSPAGVIHATQSAMPVPTSARIAASGERRFLPTTWRTTSKRIVAVIASSGRKYRRLARFPRGI